MFNVDTAQPCEIVRPNAMSGPTPLISIILVCRNPGSRLATALESIWGQKSASPEIVVIDGLSTDGTGDWLRSNGARIAHLVIQDDSGIYDAMNKGIAAATGKWILFLGADDRLAGNDMLGQATATLTYCEAQVVVGEVLYNDGRAYRLRSSINPAARNFIHHQAAFYRRELFTQFGRFDVSLAVMADYDFNISVRLGGVRFLPIQLCIAECSSGGISDSGRWRGYSEEIEIRHRYFSFGRCMVWDALSVLRYARKKILRSLAII
jgi:putative colanic acid biosynthesis glycosyltransferase